MLAIVDQMSTKGQQAADPHKTLCQGLQMTHPTVLFSSKQLVSTSLALIGIPLGYSYWDFISTEGKEYTNLFWNITLTYFDHCEEVGFSWFSFWGFLYVFFALDSQLLSFLDKSHLSLVSGSLLQLYSVNLCSKSVSYWPYSPWGYPSRSIYFLNLNLPRMKSFVSGTGISALANKIIGLEERCSRFHKFPTASSFMHLFWEPWLQYLCPWTNTLFSLNAERREFWSFRINIVSKIFKCDFYTCISFLLPESLGIYVFLMVIGVHLNRGCHSVSLQCRSSKVAH